MRKLDILNFRELLKSIKVAESKNHTKKGKDKTVYYITEVSHSCIEIYRNGSKNAEYLNIFDLYKLYMMSKNPNTEETEKYIKNRTKSIAMAILREVAELSNQI